MASYNVDFDMKVTLSPVGSQQPTLHENLLIGMGNPLLDFLAKVDSDFLKKWDLKDNDAILCDEKRLPMFEDMVNKYKDAIEYIAGGSTQNSIRACQWMLKSQQPVCTFFGCVGNDGYAKILAKKAHESGINAVYQIKDTIATGTCAVCVSGMNRSLCANLSAAEKFTVDHVEKNWSIFEKANYFYIAGFFITSCHEAVMKVAKHAAEENKCLAMNLSAPFIPMFFHEQLMQAFPYIDILFGNNDEMTAFAEKTKLKETKDMKALAVEIAQLTKQNQQRPRIVIITQGKDSVIVASGCNVRTFSTPTVDSSLIVDTNGAGDAFVGGFLSQLLQNKPLERCVDAAVWAAQQIIQRSAFSLPAKCDYV